MSSGDSQSQLYFISVVNTPVGGNEAPEFTLDTYSFIINENVANTQEIGIVTVSDDDGEYTVAIVQNCASRKLWWIWWFPINLLS